MSAPVRIHTWVQRTIAGTNRHSTTDVQESRQRSGALMMQLPTSSITLAAGPSQRFRSLSVDTNTHPFSSPAQRPRSYSASSPLPLRPSHRFPNEYPEEEINSPEHIKPPFNTDVESFLFNHTALRGKDFATLDQDKLKKILQRCPDGKEKFELSQIVNDDEKFNNLKFYFNMEYNDDLIQAMHNNGYYKYIFLSYVQNQYGIFETNDQLVKFYGKPTPEELIIATHLYQDEVCVTYERKTLPLEFMISLHSGIKILNTGDPRNKTTLIDQRNDFQKIQFAFYYKIFQKLNYIISNSDSTKTEGAIRDFFTPQGFFTSGFPKELRIFIQERKEDLKKMGIQSDSIEMHRLDFDLIRDQFMKYIDNCKRVFGNDWIKINLNYFSRGADRFEPEKLLDDRFKSIVNTKISQIKTRLQPLNNRRADLAQKLRKLDENPIPEKEKINDEIAELTREIAQIDREINSIIAKFGDPKDISRALIGLSLITKSQELTASQKKDWELLQNFYRSTNA